MTFRISLLAVFPLFFSLCALAADQNQSVWQTKTVDQWAKILLSATEKPKEKTPTIREQWYAAYSLGKYAEEAQSAVPVLLKRLKLDAGEDDDVRACILLTLASIGDEEAVPAILVEVDSDYPIMARTAVLALRKFPKKLAEATEVVEKLKKILVSHSELEHALATNCAAALWVVGEKEAVLDWFRKGLALDKEFSYARNTEIYQVLAAIHLILDDSGVETFGDDASELAEKLVEIVQKTPDADSALSACEILMKLGPDALPALRKAENLTKNPRLLSVLAATDSENAETQNLLLELVPDSSVSVPLRIAAIRGFLHFPEAKRAKASEYLVKLLNDSSADSVVANEARLVLKKLGAE